MVYELKRILILCRFQFSFFLMPVFLFAYSQADNPNITAALTLFFILHLLIYPSSNAYNSYMDKDTESVGGIKYPPVPPASLFGFTIFLDSLALLLAFFLLDYKIALMLIIYILASRAYSYRGIRLKKYPVIGFLTVGVFQGAWIYLTTTFAIHNDYSIYMDNFLGACLSFLLIASGYPLTQIYQHNQDKKDNVTTLSMMLGIRGTFLFSGLAFLILGGGMISYLVFIKNNFIHAGLFLVFLSPVSLYFMRWMKACFKDERNANYEYTMNMNTIGAVSMNIFFLFILFSSYYL